MLETTYAIMHAALKGDPTIGPAQRADLLAFLRRWPEREDKGPASKAKQQPDRVMRRAEVARILGKSLRAVDKMAQDGVLRKCVMPGRQRACGFLESEVFDRLKSENKQPASM